MLSRDEFRTAVGVLGNAISLFLFLSPTPTFMRIWKKKSVEQYSAAPYLASLMSCMVWILYGLPMVHPHSLPIITINGAGITIEAVYILIFLVYSDKKLRLNIFLFIVLELVFFALFTFLLFNLARTADNRSTVIGIAGSFFAIIMYASPLSVMKAVIGTKSVEFMPFSLSLATFMNCVTWSVYALVRFDIFIFIACGVGVICSLAQLLLYATFYNNTKRMIAARQAKSEVGLEEVVVSAVENAHA